MLVEITPVSFKEFVDSFLNLFAALGWAKALTVCFFFLLFGAVWYLMISLLKGKDAEIKRLTEDNDRYREIYLRQLDDKHGFMPPSKRISNPKKKP